MSHQRVLQQIRALSLVMILVVSVVASVGLGAFLVSAQDGSTTSDGGTEIDSCTVIDEPGRYVLTQNIIDSEVDPCIRVEDGTNNVTIDGNGYTIDGVDDEGWGIHAGLAFDNVTRNVTVENVVLTNWSAAIVYENVRNSTIRENTIESNDRGVQIFGSFQATVDLANNVLTGNDRGIQAAGPGAGRITIVDTVASNEIDYRSSSTDEDGAVNQILENFTLDTATISLENNIVLDVFGTVDPAFLTMSAVESPPADPEGLVNIGQYVDVLSGSNTAGSFTLSVHYDDEDVPAGVDEDRLALYQYVDGEWSEIPGSSVDTEANVVSATVDTPSEFVDGAVLAPLAQLDDKDGDDKDGDEKDDGTKGGSDEDDHEKTDC